MRGAKPPCWPELCLKPTEQRGSIITYRDQYEYRAVAPRTMKWLIRMVFVVCGVVVQATEWTPPDEFLRAVCYVESSYGKNLYGDNGRSLGLFQMSEAAWTDVNDWRRERGLKTYSYKGHVMNGFINRVYASNYFSILHAELTRNLRRYPSLSELYAAYNMGISTFAQCGYKLSRVNSMTRGKCGQIEQMVATFLARA